MGRYGALHRPLPRANPSDSAFIAMFKAAKTSIKCTLQDLGPVAIPNPLGGPPTPAPGLGWPHLYLTEYARAIYERGVEVHILLSYPGSVPSDLSMKDGMYGNGWTLHDVAGVIIQVRYNNLLWSVMLCYYRPIFFSLSWK